MGSLSQQHLSSGQQGGRAGVSDLAAARSARPGRHARPSRPGEGDRMEVVVASATGQIGSRSVTRLRDHGAQMVPPAQEDLVRRAALPYSLMRATPFFATVDSGVRAGVQADAVHAAPLLRQRAGGDVATPSPTPPSRCNCSASWRPPDPRSTARGPRGRHDRRPGPRDSRDRRRTDAVLRCPDRGADPDARTGRPSGRHTLVQWLKDR